jgi:hypothetical protein
VTCNDEPRLSVYSINELHRNHKFI